MITLISLRRAALLCGIFSSLLYIALNIFIPTYWPAYKISAQTVSELSAIGAPTRTLWIWLCSPYTLLMVAFAWGILQSAKGNSSLRVAGWLLISYSALGFLWPLAPMHLRDTIAAGGATFSDTLHIILGAVTELLFLGALGFAATAFGKAFKIYSVTTFIVLLIFGVLTSLDAPKISAGKPTPLIGVWERINIGAFLLWVIILATVLLNMKPSKNRHQQNTLN